ncbi:MAG: hypothetical protein ACQKBU_06135 [Verrucomicrobiales bacterium]
MKRVHGATRTTIKVTLCLIAIAGAFFAVLAGLSSASDWLILHHYQGYERSEFTITGTRMSPSGGSRSPDYYLRGTTKGDEFEFTIDSQTYRRFSQLDDEAAVIQIYRNPEMASVAFQRRSLNVLLADEWRDRSELEISAKSTLSLAIGSLFLSVVVSLTAKLA